MKIEKSDGLVFEANLAKIIDSNAKLKTALEV